MGIISTIILAIGLAMDAFAVSIGKGLSIKKPNIKELLIIGAWFGGFQALMPLIGFFIGSKFAHLIEAVDHWIAFGLLLLIGINMIREAFSKEENENNASLGFKIMFLMAIATSIDALAVGISFSVIQYEYIVQAVIIIGLITFALSIVGAKAGSIVGLKYKKGAEIAGGIILIAIGVRVLLEHLLV